MHTQNMNVQVYEDSDKKYLASLDSWASDFIWDFRKLPFTSHLGIFLLKLGKLVLKYMKLGK